MQIMTDTHVCNIIKHENGSVGTRLSYSDTATGLGPINACAWQFSPISRTLRSCGPFHSYRRTWVPSSTSFCPFHSSHRSSMSSRSCYPFRILSNSSCSPFQCSPFRIPSSSCSPLPFHVSSLPPYHLFPCRSLNHFLIGFSTSAAKQKLDKKLEIQVILRVQSAQYTLYLWCLHFIMPDQPVHILEFFKTINNFFSKHLAVKEI